MTGMTGGFATPTRRGAEVAAPMADYEQDATAEPGESDEGFAAAPGDDEPAQTSPASGGGEATDEVEEADEPNAAADAPQASR